ncbi:DUF2306 domain-containing protein [Planktotalea sp.]|uniref:DUF2306 domain-containing protein n=1 Tax=Planktotalea sp. TaxID=2029877 RepID=UPI0025E50386|nr:DUF2306 domain-containing protein [Planktotalea sp.]
MDFTPLFNESAVIQFHAACAMLSLCLAPIMLWRRKGDRLHKILGRVWVLGMALTALSSFAIQDIRLIGPFSPIYGLSLLTLYSLFNAVRYARAGNIEAHKSSILGAAEGLIGAGVFTLLPDRLMSRVFFKGIEVEGFAVVLGVSAVLFIAWRIRPKRAPSV